MHEIFYYRETGRECTKVSECILCKFTINKAKRHFFEMFFFIKKETLEIIKFKEDAHLKVPLR